MSRHVMVLSLAVVLAALAAQPSLAQTQRPDRFSEQSFVTAIDLVVEVLDAAGRTPADLQPGDLRVLENGIERRIIGVEYLDPTAAPAAPEPAATTHASPARPHWQIVIWIDAVTTSGPTLTLTTRELIKRVPDLLKFGPATLVYSDIAPEVLVDSTRDEKLLAEAIGALRKRTPGNRIMRIRREFLSALDAVREIKKQRPPGMVIGSEHVIIEPVDDDIPGYVAEEERLLAMSRRNLLSSLERLPRRVPRMLLYVGDGFDLVPGEFYLRNLDASGAALVDIGQLRAELSKRANDDTDDLMRRLALGGWTAVVVGGAANVSDDVTRSAGRRLHDNRVGTGPALVFLNSEDPLKAMADETGGERVGLAPRLQEALRDVGRRVRITYQVDREPDPDPRRVEVVANRPGLSVRAPKWASSTTTESLAESRAIESLRKEAGASDLPLTARLLPPSDDSPLPTLEVRADFSPARTSFANIGATKLRFTIAIETSGRPAPIVHQIATIENLASLRGFVWKSPMKMPENVSAIAVVAEELVTGLWGSTRFAPRDPPRAEPAAPQRAEAAAPAERLAMPQDVDAAFARAAAERKLVVAFETNDAWEGCTLDCGLLENRATSHPEIQRLMGPFIAVETPQTALPPRIAIYDPSRRLLLSWSAAFSSVNDRRRPFSTGELAEMLRRATEAAPNALRAHELASAGQLREAQMALGRAFRAARQADRAEAAWAEAARIAAAAGDRVAEQTAEVLSANMAATQGRAAEALIRLRAIAAAPASAANEAEALLVIAQIQRTAGDEKSATAALTRALQVAPAGSETYRLAARLSANEPGTRRVASADESPNRPLQLVVSGRAPFSGRTRLQVIVQNPAVSSVTFTPSEGRAITDTSPPFEAMIDLGPIPRTFEVRAVARDSEERIAGEDALTLNERHDEFWIRVRMDVAAAEVRAEMSIPEGGRLSTLRFFADGAQL
ncbi:MAG TPA: hypothetical protein VFV54_07640, partial [Thermoanaerobaculia bacterium]|nr:hypothetical protein [Thermoanaerobaculia bacterium]